MSGSVLTCEDVRVARWEAGVVALAALGFGLLMLHASLGEDMYCIGARQRASVVSDLLSGHSRGREALVGSLEYPPLPTIVMALLGLVPGVGDDPMSTRVVALGGLVCLCVQIYGRWRRAGVGIFVIVPGLIGLMMMPDLSRGVAEGNCVVVALALLGPALCTLMDWSSGGRLHDLAVCGVLMGLAMGVYVQCGILLVVCLAWVGAKAIATRKRYFLEATVLVFAMPAVYVVGLWFVGNWLILGDPMFHVKHWLGRAVGHPAPIWLVMLSGFPWQAVALVSLLAALPFLLRPVREPPRLRRAIHLCILALIVCIAATARYLPPSEGLHLVNEEIRAITRQFGSKYTNDAFIVVGYDGYDFLKAIPPEDRKLWIHVMRIDADTIRKTIDDYGGRRILLLLPATPSAEFLADLNLDLRHSRPDIPEILLLLDRTSNWLIFECLPGPNVRPQIR